MSKLNGAITASLVFSGLEFGILFTEMDMRAGITAAQHQLSVGSTTERPHQSADDFANASKKFNLDGRRGKDPAES